jgi:nucleotide-binding universal stress UspA family protein
VVDIPSSYSRFRSKVDSYYEAEVRAEAKQQNEQYLQDVTTRFAEGPLAKYHLAVTTAVVTAPDVAEAIVQTAEQGKVDFIAMATHGRGGVQHWALGSITERVLHATRVPLFIVKPQGA